MLFEDSEHVFRNHILTRFLFAVDSFPESSKASVDDLLVLALSPVAVAAGPALTGGVTTVCVWEAAVFGAGGSSPKKILLKNLFRKKLIPLYLRSTTWWC